MRISRSLRAEISDQILSLKVECFCVTIFHILEASLSNVWWFVRGLKYSSYKYLYLRISTIRAGKCSWCIHNYK